MDAVVSVVRTGGYDRAEMNRAVEEHFRVLEVDKLLRPGMRVTLKPNLLMRRTPEEGTTTHPALVSAVVEALAARGVERGRITIADSPGGPYSRALLDGIYRGTGMAAAARESGAKLNTDTGWRIIAAGEGAACREWSIIHPVLEADLVINLPKLKTHAMTTLSGAVKNLFGCVPGLIKPQLHFQFPEPDRFAAMLTDLAQQVRPALTIVDAVTSMEGDGPSAGTLRQTGLTLAGRDVFVLDRALCDLVNLPVQSVPMARLAVERGLCPEEVDHISYLCDGRPAPIRDYRHPASKSLDFFSGLPRWLREPMGKLERRFLVPKPVVQRKACIGCGKCAESCAPQAIVLQEGRKAVIRYRRCISCFCCHEMCPVKAIGIRRTPLSF